MNNRTIPSPFESDFLKGGSGSGNFGHAGRPGEVGGSGPGGGASGRESARSFVTAHQDEILERIKSTPEGYVPVKYETRLHDIGKVDVARKDYLTQQGFSAQEIERLDEIGTAWREGPHLPDAKLMRRAAVDAEGRSWFDEYQYRESHGGRSQPTDRERALLAAQRDFTVETMRLVYGDNVEVQRFVGGPSGEAARLALERGADHVDFGVNAISSFSTEEVGVFQYRGDAGGVTFRTRVPVENIWAHGDAWGVLARGEREAIVGFKSKTLRIPKSQIRVNRSLFETPESRAELATTQKAVVIPIDDTLDNARWLSRYVEVKRPK